MGVQPFANDFIDIMVTILGSARFLESLSVIDSHHNSLEPLDFAKILDDDGPSCDLNKARCFIETVFTRMRIMRVKDLITDADIRLITDPDTVSAYLNNVLTLSEALPVGRATCQKQRLFWTKFSTIGA